jgi:hypothetical protein
MPVRTRLPGLRRLLAALTLVLVASLVPASTLAASPPENGARVLQSFEAKAQAAATASDTDRTRRWVMFGLGVPLLLLVLATAALGVAMGVYGKPVYLAHMICAGLTVTLAVVHAIVGLVWFLPF